MNRDYHYRYIGLALASSKHSNCAKAKQLC